MIRLTFLEDGYRLHSEDWEISCLALLGMQMRLQSCIEKGC